MKQKSLSELYSYMQEDMKAKLHGVNAFDHATTKGDVTEVNWIDWLKAYLPRRYAVDKAFIIDNENNVSDQIDLVIYDMQYSHPVFVINDGKYITAESVYAVFEIKQTLDKGNIEYAGQKIKSVRDLIRTSVPIASANGTASAKTPHRIISGILSTDSTWVEPITENVVKCLEERSDNESIDLICCLEKSSFVVSYNKENKIKKVSFSSKDESLIFFFLELLKKLQPIGTVPAIDITSYEKAITKKVISKE